MSIRLLCLSSVWQAGQSWQWPTELNGGRRWFFTGTCKRTFLAASRVLGGGMWMDLPWYGASERKAQINV